MNKLLLIFPLFLSGCATIMWDRGISDVEKSAILFQKGADEYDDAGNNGKKLIEARDYILRAYNINNKNLRAKNLLTEMEADIYIKKKNEYFDAKNIMTQKRYIDCYIKILNAKDMNLPDKWDDNYDKLINISYEIAQPFVKTEVQLMLTNAVKLEKAGKAEDAYKIYNKVLLVDGGNSLANQKVHERIDKKNEESKKYFYSGQKEFDKKNYESALYYLNKSYNINYNRDALDLINRIVSLQKNSKYVVQAEKLLDEGNYYETLVLYKKCLYNDPTDKGYANMVAMYTEKLKKDIDSFYNDGLQKYEQGDYDNALSQFIKVNTIESGYKNVTSYIEKCRQKLSVMGNY